MNLKNLQYCSDLHLEFPMNKQFMVKNPIVPKSEVLILAGDIVPFHLMEQQNDFFSYISDHFRMTYWIPGNHEYYNNDISKRIGSFQENIRNNIVLLNNKTIIEDNTALQFSTLWTKINPLQELKIQHGMNDFRIIRNGEERFTPRDCTQFFEENIHFISNEIATHADLNKVVVTHHVPTFQNYPKEHLGSSLNSAFAVDLNGFIEKSNVDAWIYGHHHKNINEFKIGNTAMCTNQLGYVQANEHRKFKQNKTIKL